MSSKVTKKSQKSKETPVITAEKGSSAPFRGLAVVLGENKTLLTFEQSQDDAGIKELKANCDAAGGPDQIRLRGLSTWTDAERERLLDVAIFLKGKKTVFTTSSKGEDHTDLLSAVLSLLQETMPVDETQRILNAALLVAALEYPDSLDVACNKIIARRKEVLLAGARVPSLVSDAKKLRQTYRRASQVPRPDRPVSAVLPDAPDCDDLVVPEGWILGPEGIRREGCEGVDIPAPILITEIGVSDNEEGEQVWALTWKREEEWQTAMVYRSTCASNTAIVKLSARGIPVTSENAKHLVRFLLDFETQNLSNLPCSNVTDRLGWHSEMKCFLSGDRTFGEGNISFRGADTGDAELAAGFHRKGSLAKWLAALKDVGEYPVVQIALYVAHVPPLLEILNVPNFSFDLSGETSHGKTATAKIAASAWGNPAVGNAKGCMSSWEGTDVSRERAATVLSGHPFFLDDTKHIEHRPLAIEQTVYEISQGIAKSRGTIKGLASRTTFRTVLFSTGEQKLTTFTKAAGAQARVICCTQPPFIKRNAKRRGVVNKILGEVSENYGHAGPKLIQYLIKHQDDSSRWKERFNEHRRRISKIAGKNHIAGRLADSFAAIQVAGELLHRAVKLPWDMGSVVIKFFRKFVNDTITDDPASMALRYVWSWANAQQNRFAKGNRYSAESHLSNLGRWDRKPDWELLSVHTHELEKVLKDGGYALHAIVPIWKSRGWLKVSRDAKARATHRVDLNGEKVHLYSIKRSAIQELEGEQEASE